MESSIVRVESIGRPVDAALSRELKQFIHEEMGRVTGSSKMFPGMQPVSFQSEHLHLLEERDYHVCEKSDGTRVIGLIRSHIDKDTKKTAGYVFLSDRKYEFRQVSMLFPFDYRPDGIVFHNNTLVDGELLLDEEHGARVLKFYIFDLILINGHCVTGQGLNRRFEILTKSLIRPLEHFYKKYPDAPLPPFQVVLKEMYKPYAMRYIFDKVIPALKHENDGLIFTPVDAPYKPGTCYELLKWKPREMNTVDFKTNILLDPQRRMHVRLLIGHGSAHEPIACLTLEPELVPQWTACPPDGRVIECRYDSLWPTTDLDAQGYPMLDSQGQLVQRLGGWRFLRFRDDKPNANDISVYRRILEAMAHSVGKRELIDREIAIREKWHQRLEKKQTLLTAPTLQNKV